MALVLAQSSENEATEVLYQLFKSLNEWNESPTLYLDSWAVLVFWVKSLVKISLCSDLLESDVLPVCVCAPT